MSDQVGNEVSDEVKHATVIHFGWRATQFGYLPPGGTWRIPRTLDYAYQRVMGLPTQAPKQDDPTVSVDQCLEKVRYALERAYISASLRYLLSSLIEAVSVLNQAVKDGMNHT